MKIQRPLLDIGFLVMPPIFWWYFIPNAAHAAITAGISLLMLIGTTLWSRRYTRNTRLRLVNCLFAAMAVTIGVAAAFEFSGYGFLSVIIGLVGVQMLCLAGMVASRPSSTKTPAILPNGVIPHG